MSFWHFNWLPLVLEKLMTKLAIFHQYSIFSSIYELQWKLIEHSISSVWYSPLHDCHVHTVVLKNDAILLKVASFWGVDDQATCCLLLESYIHNSKDQKHLNCCVKIVWKHFDNFILSFTELKVSDGIPSLKFTLKNSSSSSSSRYLFNFSTIFQKIPW